MSFHRPHFQKSFRYTDGFSLLELLVVMSISALLIATALPEIQGTLGSINLKGSDNTLVAQLDLARQIASTRNLPVDVRLYQDISKAKDNNGNYPYRIMAIVIPATASGAANDEFLTQPVFLPENIIIDSDKRYSSVLDVSLGASGQQPVATTELSTAPSAIRNLPYTKFTYLANGTINLDSSQQWCITLLDENKARLASNNGGPAANFITVVLDVQTSRNRFYQP